MTDSGSTASPQPMASARGTAATRQSPEQHSSAMQTSSPQAPPPAPTPRQMWRDAYGRSATRALQTLILVAVIGLGVWLAVTLKIVVLPLLLALIIASAMNPIMRFLRQRAGFTRVWSAITGLVAILVGLAAVLFGIALTVRAEWSALAGKAQEGVNKLMEILTGWGIPLDDTHLSEYLSQVTEFLKNSGAESSALSGVSVATEIITGALLMIVMLFFFLLDGDRISDFLVGFLPERLQERANEAGRASVNVLGKYIRGTVVIAAFAAVCDLIAMLVMGVPLAFPLAALIFLGAFIPIVGALVTGLAAALVALVAAGPLASVVLVVVVILVNQIEHHILQPKVMGTALSLHGLVIIAALAIGAHQGGVAGALLAVPLTAVLWASFKTFRDMRGTAPRPLPTEDDDEALAAQV
ncbi:AI-2E family transporter [Kocuria tytonicola]|uniref:AI-2E family transporter n=1 Tax=Kocuria tytonicola TaxID=2055946 RepID=A0A3L9L2Z2_9MICC|nr:AI-2E family transporter [Kocuria tytonicola]RLY92339.1 AI-2E family transporter [Kocuria tytonicola]